jgi:hypothetical protein
MSLTNIVYTPVDTGLAKVSKEPDNPNSKNLYFLAGNQAHIGPIYGIPVGRFRGASSSPASYFCQTSLPYSCSSSYPAFVQTAS